jgi:hypothetical protein
MFPSKTWSPVSNFPHIKRISDFYHYKQDSNDISIAIMGSSLNGRSGGLKPASLLNVELDVERRLQADVLKDRIRIKQFF